jgi:hypothetical protein
MLMPRFSIVGGYLKVQKSVFVKEMLSADSRIKVLLNRKASGGFSEKHPGVVAGEQENIVVIDFTDTERIDIGESPEEVLGYLKSKYRDKVRGVVTCRGSMYCFEIDLNSDNDKIEYIMG